MEFSDEFLLRLKNAESIIFFTGAGISAESGIATFRGEDGLWKKLKPEELANLDAFMRNPQMVWEWYQYRRKIIENTEPNPGHFAIAQMEEYYDVSVVTQNVDNLHERAGSKIIYKLHGSIVKNFCMDCKTFYEDIDHNIEKNVPRCTECNGLIRPDVVWFGENLRGDAFPMGEKVARECDICFVVGTSAIVYPAAYIPTTAQQYGAYIVEVNIEETELTSRADYSIIGKSGEILPKIIESVKNLKRNH